MALRSDVSKKYLLRFAIVAGVLLGFSGWSFYDWKYEYPRQMEAGRMYYQEMSDEILGPPSLQEWVEVAQKNGWPTTTPPQDYPDEASIRIQLWQFVGTGVVGLLVLMNVMRRWGSWVELEGSNLRNSYGEELTLDQIKKIDKKKWDKKGIAHLYYDQDGDEGKFLLDDFIYERPTTDEILLKIEEHIGHDKIVNGKPEKKPKTNQAKPAEPAESATNA